MNTLTSVSETKQSSFLLSNRLSVSQGRQLEFAVNGKTVSGIVLGSKKAEQAEFVRVAVETKVDIPENAQLTIPSRPDAGMCGLAFPSRDKDHVKLVLYIRCSCVDADSVE